VTGVFRLMVAGGGTGGHIFPGVAVAEEILRRDREARVLFVGTGRPVEADVLGVRGLACRTIRSSGLKGKGLFARLRSLILLPVGFIQAMHLVYTFKPDVVIGVGGYVSGPVCLAARIQGRLTAIQEQNSIPGLTNRLLGRVVHLVFTGFESANAYFPAAKVHMTGNPIREEIIKAGATPMGTGSPFVLVVVGGSQGAHAINLAVAQAVKLLRRDFNLKLIHQTGSSDYQFVQEEYDDMGYEADVYPFIRDMPSVYAEADLIVCRAGALTVSEIAAMGRPSLFIPLPTAADNHQESNARWLVRAGAAEIILQPELTPETLAATIRRLAYDRTKRLSMAKAAVRVARPDATSRIVDILEERIRERKGARVS
jgi:UDP-N-acetylglucosamine--N-acetylmuramyl-(pentapeptide) pyrophosphoryl-undecaprenol N-acetylglucosamine transferase